MESNRSSIISDAWRWVAVVAFGAMPIAVDIPVYTVGKRSIAVTPYDILIWLSVLLLAVSGTNRLRRKLPAFNGWAKSVLWALWPGLLIIAAGLLSGLSGVTSKALFAKTVFQATEYLVVTPLVFLALLQEERWRDRAFWALTLGCMVCIVSISVYTPLNQVAAGKIHPHVVGGLLGNRNTYGIFMAVALCLLAGWANPLSARRTGKFPRVWRLLPGVLLPFLASYPVLAAGPLAAIVLGLTVTYARAHKAGALYGVVLVVWLIWGADNVALRTYRGRTLAESVQVYRLHRSGEDGREQVRHTVRYYRWAANLNLIRDNPLLGVGWGQYQNGIKDYYSGIPRPPGTTGISALWDIESDEPFTFSWFWVTACETGLIGLAALGLFFAEMLARSCRLLSSATAIRAPGVCGAVVALILAGLWTSPFVRGAGPLLGVLIAVSALHCLPESKVSGKDCSDDTE